MKLDIFSIPIYIDNIDCSKIKLETDKYEKIWDSNITSSHGHENKLNQESFNYILEKIWKLLNDDFHGKFKLNLENIWQNKYLEKDYQETHCHPQSHFSFIIYKPCILRMRGFFGYLEFKVQMNYNLSYKVSYRLV